MGALIRAAEQKVEEAGFGRSIRKRHDERAAKRNDLQFQLFAAAPHVVPVTRPLPAGCPSTRLKTEKFPSRENPEGKGSPSRGAATPGRTRFGAMVNKIIGIAATPATTARTQEK